MKIDRSLNVIIEISRGEAPPIYVHSAALPTEVFEQYFDICGPAMNALLTGGYGLVAPRYAALVFRKVALGSLSEEPDRPDEAYRRARAAAEARLTGFYNELHRLSYVVALKDGKWDMVLVDDAKAAGLITADEFSRMDATLVFFTLGSQSVPPEAVEGMLGGLNLFSARIESSNCTEFARSLQMSMRAANSGASQGASAPSSPGSPQMPASAPSSSDSTSSPGARPPRTGIVITRPQQVA